MNEQRIDAEVDRQLKKRRSEIVAQKLDEAFEADPQLIADIEALAARTVRDKLAELTAAAAESPAPRYADVVEWVNDYLSVVYWRDVAGVDSGHCWCAQWWRHEEAVERLTPLFQRWMQLEATAEGMLTWWAVADHHMGRLLAKDGPFSRCTPTKHYAGPDAAGLPCMDPPEEGTPI
ncbi:MULTISPECIES: DUF4913 domain-containing protein [Nocardia]|uniref:DUF4913 domain-containing protein n=1 Tax=Nocardia TaxID=1817 RepID=UPI002454222F|nr:MULTISPECIES: DUF4913 domain-containing protein [Nocardia]